MTIGPVNAPQFSLPSIPVGAQVAVDDINAAGGVSGHKLQLITCNDKNNPNTATQCARQAITEKVAAVVGGLSLFDLKIIPELKRAGIPWVGLVTGDDYTSDNLYLFAEGAPDFVGIGMTLAQAGCKNIAVITSGTAEAQNAAQIQAGVKAGGAKVAGNFKAPANSSDWAPTVAAAKKAGADCIGSGTSPAESGPLLAAAQSAGPWKHIAFASGGMPPALVKQLGKAANGVLEPAGEYPFTANKGVMQELKQKILAKGPAALLDPFATVGYASTKVAAEAAKSVKGDVTAAAMTGALPKVSGFDTGVGIVATLSPPNSLPQYARVFQTKVYVLEAKNGELILAKPDPIDTTPGLKLLSSS